MSVKVTVERGGEKPGISLKDGDVCLLRCGGVVMIKDSPRADWPLMVENGDARYRRDGVFSGLDDAEHPFDIIEVLGNGADFLKRVEVVVRMRGE